jgi:GntR family transcriptional regulator, transcriptional repressor for pyruvate dehydrogenase complex
MADATRPSTPLGDGGSRDAAAAEQIVAHVCAMIERGALRPGDRLDSERGLALHVGVSRTSVRAGLRWLAAMGVVQTRRGAGTFITDGPPTLVSEPLRLVAALHGLDLGGLFEVRRVLEAGTASLAAERATPEQIATLSDEVTGMYSALHDPHTFLDYDLRFHRAVATAANNPMLGPSSRPWPPSSSSSAGPRSSARTTCASLRTCTGRSTRPSGPATRRQRARRWMSTSVSRRSPRPPTTLPWPAATDSPRA